jgi:hypothetical protein
MVDHSGNRTHRRLGTSPFPVHESSCQSNCGKRRRCLGGISQTDKHDSAASLQKPQFKAVFHQIGAACRLLVPQLVILKVNFNSNQRTELQKQK